jgi:excinuclease ABC subunit A
MPIEEALTHFRHHKAVAGRLQALFDVGLGYLSLGQSANTLSGGEAQRVKLAAELVSRKGHCVYILDEPTTGLHMADIAKLVEVLQRLVSKGHTVVTIEHQIDVLWQADWLIDLGPAGGSGGGEIMAEGAPQIVAQSDSATARALRKFHVDRALSS